MTAKSMFPDEEWTAEAFPIRVGLARKDADAICNGANEVFMLEPKKITSRRHLADFIKDEFRSTEKKGEGINVPDRCFWGNDYDAERLKVSWDPPNTYSSAPWAPGASMSETEITNANFKSILVALKLCPPSSVAISVLITHKIPADLQTAY